MSNIPPPEKFKLPVGLSRKEAMAKAPKPKKDRRGFFYDPKTGKGQWT